MENKLKVGLLINDYNIPAWEYKMIEDIINSNHSIISLVVKKTVAQKEEPNKGSKLWNNRHQLLQILYGKIENKLFNPKPNAFEVKNLKNIIDCPEIIVSPKETKFSDIVNSADIKNINEHNIDVFLRLGFRILRGEILNAAKYGVWSYHHGDNAFNRGGPAGTWEVMEKWPETGVILQILTEDLDGGLTLTKSLSSTDSFSIKRNKNNYYWKATSFVPRKLKELHSLGGDTFMHRVALQNEQPSFYSNRLFVTPKNSEILKFLVSNIIKVVKGAIRKRIYFNQWILLFKIEKTEKISQSFFRYKRITPPKDRFWADPFVLEKNNKYYIFLEELVYSETLGKISVIEMDERGNYTKPQVVLKKDYHLSYPYLIEDHKELYMIPETLQNNRIELYKCTAFPHQWELHKVLMNNVKAVDTTIFKYNSKYWLFCNIKEYEGASTSDELFLFYSENLLSDDWKPHALNPIVSDVRCSRPAGELFIQNNRIYRPAQNCAKHYGHGMQIQEILVLNENEYEEKTVQSIFPNWAKDLSATHTINSAGKLTVIDALIRRKK